jgi:hypothetical protein
VSDPIAVSILAKLTSWYSFDGNANDAHGSNPIDEVTSLSYEAGLKGQRLAAGCYGNATLASPIAISATSGHMTIGGWFYYNGTTPSANIPAFGLAWGPVSGNEAFKIIVNSDGYFYAGIWGASGQGYNIRDPLTGAKNYPITVQVQDSLAQTATSDQLIRITNGGPMQAGWYFVVATWDEGNRVLYMDGVAVATEPPPALGWTRSSITWAGVGRSYGGNTPTTVACDECFFCDSAVLTAAEVAWLFNRGAGRSYADVVAAAA